MHRCLLKKLHGSGLQYAGAKSGGNFKVGMLVKETGGLRSKGERDGDGGKMDILENVPERMEKAEQLIQVCRKKEKLEGWTKLTLVSRLRNRNLPHQKLSSSRLPRPTSCRGTTSFLH